MGCMLKRSYATEQAKVFMNTTEFPNTDAIMDAIYMSQMNKLVDDSYEVSVSCWISK